MGPHQRVVEIEFLYLDLSSCGRCMGSDASLREAINLLHPVLAQVGVTVSLHTIHVTTAAQAQQLRLVSSPTIRINGADIAGELAETVCGDCTAISAGDAPMGCRVWRYRGQQYTDVPAALIIDAVLGHLYGGRAHAEQARYYGLTGNLAGFFGASGNANTAQSSRRVLRLDGQVSSGPDRT